ncbi:hypothetical protein GUITHDRAFT_139336 [Guillardia theta CCMP2712]|uniref:tRNA-uridine aminocarboxypropyltransferase n=1 Tax=Guillardia theta (strain CCMP2712) TaxID=905079 RepID=L1J958_GUITC|nr:hypothetical protein GUITHDRAFT_139336 [Guillardia theta CCMP2712]EKX45066.1 hypothetical protein GUITHDRAFT_139336 [Guillardia theta CCMP2712]|eukprot:XP_005832046.1 hypothetical protein GUITHDRAFT_139336 [Guillardia theta CCMP2712]
MGRAVCQRCGRPETVCVCSSLPAEKIMLKTKILVVQHPCECHKKIIGTVPLMELVLDNMQVVVARGNGAKEASTTRGRRGRKVGSDEGSPLSYDSSSSQDDSSLLQKVNDASDTAACPIQNKKGIIHGTLDGNPALEAALSDKKTLLLYPGPGAVDIETLQLDDSDSERTLIVVDGTWRQAGRVIREECIRRAVERGDVTRVQFARAGRSGYKFRKEPHQFCLSTLESVAYSLQYLEKTSEGERAVCHLMDTFSQMVSLQTSYIAKGGEVKDVNEEEEEEEDLDKRLVEIGSYVDCESAHKCPKDAVPRPYALFRQIKDYRTGKDIFVQDSEEMVCRKLNSQRKRGSRLTVLPIDAKEGGGGGGASWRRSRTSARSPRR